MQPETFERVSQIVAAFFDIPKEKVDADVNLEELGVDSLGALELIFKLEEEFNIVVPNDRASEFTTLRRICEGIEELLKQKVVADQ